jgi:iron complex transport system substrate-binding protein
LELDEITGAVVDESIRIHRGLGPGVFESVYEVVLAAALERRGLRVERQLPISISFDGIDFEQGFCVDLLVEECVIVELKSIERLAPVHTKQLLTYLRLSNLKVGLLLNFGADIMKEGLRRVVNDLAPSASPRLRVNQRAIALRDRRY